jgi:V/A-type H+-transporting ATPase subunit I
VIHHHFEPLDQIPIMLGIGIAIGVCLILLGIVLNIVNRLKRGDVYYGVFDRFGVIGMIFYVGALVAAADFLITRRPPWWVLVAMVFLPLGVLLLRSPLYRLIVRRKPPAHDAGGAFASAIESGAEIMETISGLLANTISFARVGAFALSHAGLCMVMVKLMKMVAPAPGGILWQGLILLAGNVIVIVLEGLITTIQIVRLEWYEFFGKFFEPKGTAYAPFAVGTEEPARPPEVESNA